MGSMQEPGRIAGRPVSGWGREELETWGRLFPAEEMGGGEAEAFSQTKSRLELGSMGYRADQRSAHGPREERSATSGEGGERA